MQFHEKVKGTIMPKFVVKQPKNQRPMINDTYTASVKRKMSYAIIPFVAGAIVLVFSMGQGIEDKMLRLACLIIGLVLFVAGILVFAKYARDLNIYAREYWEKEDRKGNPVKEKAHKEDAPKEKITWAQAAAEYKAEAKATAHEATKIMASKFVDAETQNIKEQD